MFQLSLVSILIAGEKITTQYHYKDNLLYHYYGGIIYAKFSRYDRALEMFEIVTLFTLIIKR